MTHNRRTTAACRHTAEAPDKNSLKDLEDELVRILDRNRVKTGLLDLEMYAYDSSPFAAMPDMVVFPETTEETAKIIQTAGRFRVPVMPRGAGTCLSGGAVPVNGGISLSMTRMNRILDIDPFSRTALVEPGVVNLNLQRALDPLNLMFPPDPASQKVATIGGNVAECAGGIQGARYGVTKNYVLGLELVLADGRAVTTGMLSREETLGPDFTGIFNGSEGAFAMITKILVSLREKPESFRTALAVFADLNDAALAVSGIIGRGIIPTALELMDQTMLRAVDDYAKIGFPEDAEAVLLMEVDGYAVDLDRQLDLMVQVCLDKGARSVEKAASALEREALWKARRSGNGALGRIRPAYTVHDVTVPRNQVAPLLTRIRSIGDRYGIIIAQMAHAGDGNAHPHLLYYPDEKDIQRRIHEATADIFQAALDLGGTISGEHGIGLEKMPFMTMQFSGADLDFMGRVKAALDPEGLLNPGKVLPGPGKLHNKKEGPADTGIPGRVDSEGVSGGIIEFIPDNMTIKVSADTPLNQVQDRAETINAWLPLEREIHGETTLGRLIEQGAGGLGAMAWGSLREYIFGMEFTTNAGDRVRTGGHTAKNVAGFDFTRLLWKSGGRIGRVETVTLKLMPRPESRGMVCRQFADLSACLAAARRVLEARLPLVTLVAESLNGSANEKGWNLAVGLAGSEALVSARMPRLAELLGNAGTGTGQKTPDILLRDREKEFRQGWAERQRSFPFPVAGGCGSRRSMFRVLEDQASFLDRFLSDDSSGIRVELDLGYPSMTVSAKEGNAVGASVLTPARFSLQEAGTGTGFYLSPAGERLSGPLYHRLTPLLTGKSPEKEVRHE